MTFHEAIHVLLSGRIMDVRVAGMVRPGRIGAVTDDAVVRLRVIAAASESRLEHDVAIQMRHLAEVLGQVAADATLEAAETKDPTLAADAARLTLACAIVREHCRSRPRSVA